MSVIGKRVIFVGPADGANHKPLNVEGVCLDAMLPGTVVAQSSTGLATSAAAATAFSQQFLVADKDQQRTKSVDDVWTVSENMVAIAPRSGEFVNVLVAATQDITSRGIPLSRNGSGLLAIALTDGTHDIVGYSDEIVDTTGGPAGGTLVCVRVA